jgi:hypothetical protein
MNRMKNCQMFKNNERDWIVSLIGCVTKNAILQDRRMVHSSL